MGISGYLIAKAAQHKLINQLHHKLKPDGVFVGKVNVNAIVKGSAFDDGTAKIEPDSVADAALDLFAARSAKDTNVDNPAPPQEQPAAAEESEGIADQIG